MSVRARISAKSQIVVPKTIRERLGLQPGDQVVFKEGPQGVTIERAPADEDPFASFSEWSSAADDEAYSDL